MGRAAARRLLPSSRSPKPNTPSVSPRSTSGFAPATSISSTSPRPSVSMRTGSVAALYARLRARQPVDYGAFLHWQAGPYILSFSPELFFRVEQRRRDAPHRHAAHERHCAARPHHARRPRDRRVAAQRPEKPQRKCDDRRPAAQRPGPRRANSARVRAENLFVVERYPTLWQMTSTVTRRAAARSRLSRDLPRAVSLRLRHRRAQSAGHAAASPSSKTRRAACTPAPSASFRRSKRSSTWPFARWN